MPLNMTKIAFGAESPKHLRERLAAYAQDGEVRITTRYLPKRAHQGWRYLEEANAPPDLDSIETDGRDEMSPKMLNELMKMGLV
ncbi:DUF1489 family protein [Sphingorhabdus sp.]|jgi:hypothetical protein|uniref:DUF1489 family protein n=2 Tax=Sphingorhabdus sp. TaxID=1902408 RepID=UPI00273E2115|nr:DUF1489 family protein [Sphingorhabdus sp.]MDP4928002.1 DUF1489 domain-containing protein [Sphingorhabdus sp.]